MLIRKLDPDKFVHAYNVDIQLLYPWEGKAETPFGAAWAIVPPGGSTKHHNHQEGETFFIAKGRGVMSVGDESAEVEPGDVVFQQPFQKHILRNTSETEDLLFLTVWWEDKELWPEKERQAESTAADRRVLVTAAPPTPNGDLHIGHISGPYLAADLYKRYLRQRGVEAYYACGSDDNSVYVKSKADEIGLPRDGAAAHFVGEIEETLKASRIDMDVFVHPNDSPHHRQLTQEFFQRLHDDGKLVAKEVKSPYLESQDLYLFEPYLSGRCPACGAGVVGLTCEDCGRVNDGHDLVEPICTLTGEAPQWKSFTRLFFPLSQYADMLTEYHRTVAMSPHLRTFCEKLIHDGLPDVAVTHVTDWGIPVPVEGFDDQRIYVWLEMAPRYFAYSRHVNEKYGIEGDYDRYWKEDGGEVVQCFGFDNSFYYALFLPALYKAFDAEIRLPRAFITNEFYRLDGEKFSTSRRHAIWAQELISQVPADVVRFYLAYTAPETEGTNFTLENFRATVQRELVDGWQRWLADLGQRVADELDGVVPSTGDWTEHQHQFYRKLERLTAEAAAAYEADAFSPQQVSRVLCEIARTARRFGKGQDHWRGVPDRGEEVRSALALELLAAKQLALIAAPLMPEFAARLWSDLGFESSLAEGSWQDGLQWVPSGQQVGGLDRRYFEAVGKIVLERARRLPAGSTA